MGLHSPFSLQMARNVMVSGMTDPLNLESMFSPSVYCLADDEIAPSSFLNQLTGAVPSSV